MANGPFLSIQGNRHQKHRRQPWLFRVTAEEAAGGSAPPRKQGVNCPVFCPKVWPRVSVRCHLSALMDRTGVSQKKYQIVFSLTAGLDNEVQMTLSLIKVICRNH